nr:hypothetical protein [Methyloceanibacter marginalis]
MQSSIEKRFVGRQAIPNDDGCQAENDAEVHQGPKAAIQYGHGSARQPLGPLVRGETQQIGCNPRSRTIMIVRSLTGIGRFDVVRSFRNAAVGIQLESEQRWEALAIFIAGLTIDNQRKDRPVRMARLEARISSFTRWLFAAAGEQITMRDREASNALVVASDRAKSLVSSRVRTKCCLCINGRSP